MSALRWSGVAMVEFKWQPSERAAWLMEINGRFWGSMQLAVASGVDFPWLVFKQEVLGHDIGKEFPVRKHRLVWIPGDLDHFLLRLRQRGTSELGSMLRDWIHTRGGLPLDTDTLRFTDPAPFVLEMLQWLSRSCVSILGGLRPAGRRNS
jgi:predicted ATP-grasp superfamily ATP-dependent carboligase